MDERGGFWRLGGLGCCCVAGDGGFVIFVVLGFCSVFVKGSCRGFGDELVGRRGIRKSVRIGELRRVRGSYGVRRCSKVCLRFFFV